MRPIVKAILIIADDYMKVFDTKISGDKLILDYIKNNKIYYTIKIEENKGMLVLTFKKEKTTKTIPVDELKDILDTYKKEQ